MRGLIARAPSTVAIGPSHRTLAVLGTEPTPTEPTPTTASPKRTLRMAWTAAAEADGTSRLAGRWCASVAEESAGR
jgi:hypothetical protein